jgi:hypothetical protein
MVSSWSQNQYIHYSSLNGAGEISGVALNAHVSII